MTTTKRAFSLAVLLAVVSLGYPSAELQAGPLSLCNTNQPFLWPNGGANIVWNPDRGRLGPLRNRDARALVDSAFDAWQNVSSSTISFSQGSRLPVNVRSNNFGPWLNPPAPDGLTAIVFDQDGSIFNILFGPNSGILGFASPEWVNTASCTILEGVAFLNGGAFSIQQEMLDIAVHEFGHMINLAHTVVNGQIVLGDTSGPNPDSTTFPVTSLVNLIETMYPFYFGTAAGTSTPHPDDIAMVSTLYPAAGFFTNNGTIAGTIRGTNGTTPLTGVSVIARNISNPFGDAVSAISGDFGVAGVYTINGLTLGGQYVVFVNGIVAGGFSTTPLSPLPGPEEYYNGALESNNPLTDNPLSFTVLNVNGVLSGIDIIFQ